MRVGGATGAIIFGFVILTCGLAIAQPQAQPPATGPAAAPTPSDSPIAAPAPTPTPTPMYRFIYRATPAPNTTPFPGPGAPEIDEIDLSDSTLVPPANIYGRVLTNPAVVSVTAQTMGATLTIPEQSPGVFGLAASIPDVPQFLRNRSFDVTFTATVSDGRVASVTIPLTIR